MSFESNNHFMVICRLQFVVLLSVYKVMYATRLSLMH